MVKSNFDVKEYKIAGEEENGEHLLDMIFGSTKLKRYLPRGESDFKCLVKLESSFKKYANVKQLKMPQKLKSNNFVTHLIV